MPKSPSEAERVNSPRRLTWHVIVLGVFLASCAGSARSDAAAARARRPIVDDGADAAAIAYRHGWGYLVDRLVADGVPRARAAAAFADPRIPRSTVFRFNSRRGRAARATASSRARRASAPRACAAPATRKPSTPPRRARACPRASSPRSSTSRARAARATGRQTVLHRLARLAMANEPANLADNVRRHAGEPADPLIAEQVRARAAYLESTFYPELRGLFTVTERLGLDPLALQGSGSGAFGYPQFLPTSYLRYGVDGNGDGRVSLYDMDDAAASCARFLAENGWKPGLTLAEQRRVIWQYNRSDAYIDTILALHRDLAGPERPTRVADKSRRRP